MNLLELDCKNCGAGLDGRSLNERLGLLQCAHCNSLFAIEQAQARGGATVKKRTKVELPPRMQLQEIGNRMVLTRSWRSPAAIALTVFAVFWNGFMLVWHGIALSQGQWMMSAFGLIHTSVGVGVGYAAAAALFNRTTIQVGSRSLAIDHAPLPWPGKKTIDASNVEQLFIKEKIVKGKNGTHRLYQVMALARGGGKQKLVSGLHDVNQALFIEQEIERFLGLEDRPVEGEWPRAESA